MSYRGQADWTARLRSTNEPRCLRALANKRMHLTVGAPVREPHRLQVMRGVRRTRSRGIALEYAEAS
jgi:hypothetical protein